MPIRVLRFAEFQKTLPETGEQPLDALVRKAGIAYVIAVTREKCPGCEKQKPLFEQLSDKMIKKYRYETKFFRVHAAFTSERREEAKQCASTFHTAAFPTYMIAVKDNDGKASETYRAIEPPMREIERNIKTAVQVAAWFKTKQKNQK